MIRHSASFRDPAGYVFKKNGEIFRAIDSSFSSDWEAIVGSGFFDDREVADSVVPFSEVEPIDGAWKTVQAEVVPFVSYPYEWCFSQLRDAGLLTLMLLEKALDYGLVMKDASAYNVLFDGRRPVFIDLLSFQRRVPDTPWVAYRQFCMHFLAPLSLTALVDVRLGSLSKQWVGGIPLDLACKPLPFRAWTKLGLLWHLFLHAKMELKHGGAEASARKAKKIKVRDDAIRHIAGNLRSVISRLRLPKRETEWSDYYHDTNYTESAAVFKAEFVKRTASSVGAGELAVDLGANTGKYSKILAAHFRTVVAADVDPLAVERHYLHLKANGPDNILPLVIDLANPSPSIGWECSERDSFMARTSADLATALALIHHITFTMEIPLERSAHFFAELVRQDGLLLLEFVPMQDSQMKRLLAIRDVAHVDYSIEVLRTCYSKHFIEVEWAAIPESERSLHVFKRK